MVRPASWMWAVNRKPKKPPLSGAHVCNTVSQSYPGMALDPPYYHLIKSSWQKDGKPCRTSLLTAADKLQSNVTAICSMSSYLHTCANQMCWKWQRDNKNPSERRRFLEGNYVTSQTARDSSFLQLCWALQLPAPHYILCVPDAKWPTNGCAV